MSGRAPAGRLVLFLAIALGGAAFDLATKWWVFRELGPPNTGPALSVIGNVLELRTSHNPGALWGFGRDWEHSSLVFALLSCVAGVAICWWLFVRGGARDLTLTIALALIMAGAIGNCHDRLVFGYVRDFVHFHVDAIGFDFAIFNFADNMLVAGAVILMLLALRPEPTAPAASETPGGEVVEPATSV
ncbi:MAG: signal peptidase II [Isosphaeraceae bacterium]|nr:signal peptidase II [Isosphaeraceae bacterium]